MTARPHFDRPQKCFRVSASWRVIERESVASIDSVKGQPFHAI